MKIYLLLVITVFIGSTMEELVWEKLTPTINSFLPVSRRDAAIAYDETKNTVYIFGGKSAKDRSLKSMYKFDLNKKIWQPVSSSKITERYSMVFGNNKEYFFVASGQAIDKDGNTIYHDDLWRFHFQSNIWEELSLSKNPERRYSAAGGIHKDGSSFVISHGAGDNEKFSNTFLIDAVLPDKEWNEVYSGGNSYNPSYPHARSQHSGTMVSKDKLLIFGGCLSGYGTGGPCPSDDSWIFDLASKEWTELNRCSSPKISSAMARLPRVGNTSTERVVMWGGNADSRTTLVSDNDKEDEIAVFDLDKEKWMMKKTKAKETFPLAREGHVMVTVKDGVLVFGGEDISTGELLADIWLLRGNIVDAEESANGRDCGRQYFNLVMLHGIFMFIGWAVFLIMGIFSARYFRFLQPTWFRLHMTFQILGAVLILAGTICGIISVPSHEHFKFAHSVFGYLLFVMVIQQPFNAMLRPQPTEQGFNCGRAFWEIWHKWSGRLIVLGGVANITLGLFLAVAPSLVWILWLAYVGLWIGIFVLAEIVKRPFEKELRRRAKKPVVYDTTNPYRIARGQVNTAF